VEFFGEVNGGDQCPAADLPPRLRVKRNRLHVSRPPWFVIRKTEKNLGWWKRDAAEGSLEPPEGLCGKESAEPFEAKPERDPLHGEAPPQHALGRSKVALQVRVNFNHKPVIMSRNPKSAGVSVVPSSVSEKNQEVGANAKHPAPWYYHLAPCFPLIRRHRQLASAVAFRFPLQTWASRSCPSASKLAVSSRERTLDLDCNVPGPRAFFCGRLLGRNQQTGPR